MKIPERMLHFADGGRDIGIAISVDLPIQGKHDWSCRYRIGWPEGAHEGFGYGVDATQALLLAMEAIGTDLYTSDHHRSGQLRWHDLGAGYEYPVPKTIRDLLIGGDAAKSGET
ncbi:MAG TPA: hypothetical protein VGN82_15195 [Bosea sp. (in: a-proteobacteria)]|jgi:hypothetical protein|uniref:DUF6968 family protein n=1 Tax=Bosea sp. (in: a-proteobacteria) TaxID=1871050 RepID=UPI002E11174B|nr:hypothetical protein [Bosea sp. (in: a-proteobacteria)]